MAAATTEVRTDSDAANPDLNPARRLATARLAREWKTIRSMIQLYCRCQHGGSQQLCPECQGLLDYAALRLDRCRFGSEKPTCAKCPVHCYHTERRTQIKAVMRFAGPRMLWEHPLLSLRHWLDSLGSRSRSAELLKH